MVERILVGVDASAPSLTALSWALDRAERSGVPVLLVHVQRGDAPDSVGAAAATSPLLHELLERSRREHPTLEVGGVLLHGDPAWELSAATRSTDLLVIGTHKTGYVRGRALGSRSIQMASTVECTIVITPAHDGEHRRGVVAGISTEEMAVPVAAAAATEAMVADQALLLVHASEEGEESGDRASPLSTAVDVVHLVAPSISPRALESTRPPAELLLDIARDRALLVLGMRTPGERRTTVSAVTHDILMNPTSPVMLVPHGRSA